MNHFLEVDQDTLGNKYLIVHSGSRNLGLQVAKYYQEKAKEYCDELVVGVSTDELVCNYKNKMLKYVKR